MRLDFSVAVHSLLYLQAKQPEKVTSAQLADLMAVNAVVIRNTLSLLHKKGYIKGTVGKNGGYTLTKKLAEINVGDLYDLTIPPILSYARFITGDVTANALDPDMASDMATSLTDLFTLADDHYRAFYHEFSMADLAQDLKHHGYFKTMAKEKGLI
ncbi:transcriptional regulator [Agrilactobacillus composti DSM 18527 = JCM 14202]|uniref:Transcriptional regulator n=1 Tax=Agrilactobacillus composti DSM 18527 = JCM 14202 TaxID=1423734 RepID=X0PP55_9LACO|nr:Rrf2 family transcriptional regulator [Agrilactobacillus composti]KRM31565.1 transcriptional regulator [Agrilactobacillus composti DSM 18527 = JCM 14202]GAF39412.1 predicted transcriptional regulator [Agrilactobacillus composti DSM 18527 = JCM 14202]